ncbi:prolipoprotein diacylglyceryl transferase [Dokdonia sinensis]|uniref:Prolipoprotein diacylglyceryl transferase n=1 Tax=Dokdonia sinensis TaxID=2479847 RepID=A0A3M0GHB7_9FLAO|nr:DUF6787 family protein [Dokdonia sinensis]RMB64054.1 prolipoprotein diacylglyceryl transferase [Dokdonia sinensis]
MKNFKRRWEITRNWQLIYPFLGFVATFFCGYLISKGIVKKWVTPETTSHLVALIIGTIIVSIMIIRITLWLFTKLYKRWGVTYRWELIAMFLVFAITGSTSGKLSDPLMELIGMSRDLTSGWIYWPVRILLIFPIYQVLLVIFGWIFGQYDFFKSFAIKMVSRMGLGFLFSKQS